MSRATRECFTCGVVFTPRAPDAQDCPACQRDEHRKGAPANLTHGEHRRLLRTLDDLARENRELRKANLLMERQAQPSDLARERDAAVARTLFLESRVALLEMQLRQPSGRSEAIPSDMLKTLIRLAHPDRHGNSPAANKATAWLLKARGNPA